MLDSNDVMIGGGGGVTTGMDEPTHKPKFTAT